MVLPMAESEFAEPPLALTRAWGAPQKNGGEVVLASLDFSAMGPRKTEAASVATATGAARWAVLAASSRHHSPVDIAKIHQRRASIQQIT